MVELYELLEVFYSSIREIDVPVLFIFYLFSKFSSPNDQILPYIKDKCWNNSNVWKWNNTLELFSILKSFYWTLYKLWIDWEVLHGTNPPDSCWICCHFEQCYTYPSHHLTISAPIFALFIASGNEYMSFPLENHSPRDKTGPYLVAFPQCLEDMVLSVSLKTAFKPDHVACLCCCFRGVGC